MVRKLVILLAFLAVWCQAWEGASFPRVSAGEFGHVLAHAQQEGHHHHDEGALHVDDADETGFHVHPDGANAALPAALSARAATAAPHAPPGWTRRSHRSPTMGDLLRPPEPTA